MAEAKVVRGSVGGVAVTVNEETADLLGSDFEQEKSTARKAASSSKSSK